MATLVRFLDRTIDAGLVLLLVFTPLAFGTVEEWSKAVAQLLVLLTVGAWLLKITWSPPPSGKRPGRFRRVWGGRVELSGLELPGLALAAVVVVQLIPLPPAALSLISPRTAEIYASSLPGWGESADPTFRDLPRWLQRSDAPEAGGVPALPPDPDSAAAALPEEVFDLPHPGWRPISLTPGHTRRALQIYLSLLALFVVIFNQLAERRRARAYFLLLSGMAGLISVTGILQAVTAEGRILWLRTGSSGSFGPFVNHNNFAGWMALVLPLCGALAIIGLERWRGDADPTEHLLDRAGRAVGFSVLLGFVTVVSLAAFLFARSRGGLLALLTAAALYGLAVAVRGALRARTVVWVALVVIVATAMAAWVGGGSIWERYGTLGRMTDEQSFRFRVDTSQRTLGLARDFPVVGTGLGTFEEAFYLYDPGTTHKRLARAHNDYAQLLAECGLAGGLALLWGLWVLIRRGIAPAVRQTPSGRGWLVHGAALGVTALLLHELVDFDLQIYAVAVVFVFVCAFLLREADGDVRPAGSY